MQTTAIRTVANSLPQNEVILLTLLISKRYIPNTDLQKPFAYRAVQDGRRAEGLVFSGAFTEGASVNRKGN